MRVRPILLGLLATAGCYRYVPTELPGVAAGTQVAVDLTSAGGQSVRPALGDAVTVLEGSVQQASAEGLTLSLASLRRRGDVNPSTWNGETVSLRSTDIERVRQRQLARGRTIGAAAALGAGSIALIYAIARAAGILEVSSGSGKGPPPPP